jgi:signal transduction histidine kinase
MPPGVIAVGECRMLHAASPSYSARFSRLSRLQRVLLWAGGGLVGGLLGLFLLIQQAIEREHANFETGARIAHRLLSQRAVQHEAVLTTLSLMQPALNPRLPAVYPQILQLMHRVDGQPWPGPPALQNAFLAAEKEKGGPRPALADLTAGRFWIMSSSGSGAAYALELSLQLMVPWDEWPFGQGASGGDGNGGNGGDADRLAIIHAWLEYGGAKWTIQEAGIGRNSAGELRRFTFRKQLASQSQPFDLVVERSYRISDLSWPWLALWTAVWTLALTGLAHVLRQRRARQRAEELLRLGQVSRLNALGELAAGLAHELNQPLTAVLAGTQAATRMLADDPPELAAARNAMTQTVSQARRAAEVVARLRRVIERPNSGERKAIDLAGAAGNVLHLLEPECARRGVAVQLIAGDIVLAQADPVALDQILHNLIGNALNALDGIPQPQLTLRVSHPPGSNMVSFSVRDNGCGVPPELANRLFEPFVSGRPGGLGLGLSLCETLAEEMGGRVRYRPASPGTEFILELPSAQPPTETGKGTLP